MKITYNLFYSCFFLCCVFPHHKEKSPIENHVQVGQIAIKDFAGSELYKSNSFFFVSFYDTVNRMELKKIKDNNYKWVRGKVYPDIVAVNILPDSNKFFVDTTIETVKNKGIPSRCIEKDGKLFFWYDDHYPVTNHVIKMLDRHHLLWRGAPINAEDHPFVLDELTQSTQYYFCKNNLSVFKKVVTSKAIGNYDPPDVKCKQQVVNSVAE